MAGTDDRPPENPGGPEDEAARKAPDDAEPEFDAAGRELCPDGACVGVIGPDGRCKACGTVSPTAVQDPRHRGLRPDDEVAEIERERDRERERSAGGLEAAPEDFEDRELCPDGACIGVIGPDGRCKACGTPAGGGGDSGTGGDGDSGTGGDGDAPG